MNKKSVLWIILDLIFLIVFNVAFFVISGFEHPASVWLSYGFIHFAYLMILITPYLITKSSSAVVFGFSLYSISALYFIIEFIVGLIFIFLKQDSIKPALVIQIIITGIYAINLISHMIANENTAENLERHEQEVSFIKTSSSRVKMLIGRIDDKKVNKELEKIFDLLHSSPTKTTSAVYYLEKEINDKISQLEYAVAKKDETAIMTLAGELELIIEQRNSNIRLNQ